MSNKKPAVAGWSWLSVATKGFELEAGRPTGWDDDEYMKGIELLDTAGKVAFFLDEIWDVEDRQNKGVVYDPYDVRCQKKIEGGAVEHLDEKE